MKIVANYVLSMNNYCCFSVNLKTFYQSNLKLDIKPTTTAATTTTTITTTKWVEYKYMDRLCKYKLVISCFIISYV